MTTPTEFDRLLDLYFDDGRDELADRVIDAVLIEIDHTNQRRRSRVPRRLDDMTTPFRLAMAAVIGVLLAGSALVFLRPGAGTVGGPVPSTAPATVVPSPAAAPSASPSGSPSMHASSWRVTGSPERDHGNEGVTITLQDGRVLVAGGVDGSTTGSNVVEIYDPQAGTWSTTSPMKAGRTYPVAVRLADGKVLVAGGDPVRTPTPA
jgi:hypothetical protein